MENIPHGITIESYSVDTQAVARTAGEDGLYSLHTWRDLHLIPVCQPIVQPPLEKTMTLDVEGMSGVADLSHGLTGYPIFKDREGSWQFWLDTDSYQESIGYYGPVGDRAYREIKEKLVSLMRSPYQTRIVLDDDPSFYYIGRIWMDGKPSYQYDHAKFTLQYRLYPYKYMRNEYGGDWLWDTFRFTTDFADTRSTGSGMWNWDSFYFETDLATPKMKEVAMKAGQSETFPLVFTDKPSAVFVTSSKRAAANLTDQNGETYTMVEVSTTNLQGIDTETPQQDSIRYQFRTRGYPVRLESLMFGVSVLAQYKKTSFTVSIYKKGMDVALTSVDCTTKESGSYDGRKAIAAAAELKVRLEANTTYLFRVTGSKPYRPNIVISKDSAEDMRSNDYIDQLPSEDTITYNEQTVYPVLVGTMDLYAGQGAILEPNTRTNIGTVGRNVDDSGRTVTVIAEEDTVIDIEYCPAYL